MFAVKNITQKNVAYYRVPPFLVRDVTSFLNFIYIGQKISSYKISFKWNPDADRLHKSVTKKCVVHSVKHLSICSFYQFQQIEITELAGLTVYCTTTVPRSQNKTR